MTVMTATAGEAISPSRNAFWLSTKPSGPSTTSAHVLQCVIATKPCELGDRPGDGRGDAVVDPGSERHRQRARRPGHAATTARDQEHRQRDAQRQDLRRPGSPLPVLGRATTRNAASPAAVSSSAPKKGQSTRGSSGEAGDAGEQQAGHQERLDEHDGPGAEREPLQAEAGGAGSSTDSQSGCRTSPLAKRDWSVGPPSTRCAARCCSTPVVP